MIILYIDPGAGSMVIQALLAAVLTVPFILRARLRRAVEWIRSFRSAATEDQRSSD